MSPVPNDFRDPDPGFTEFLVQFLSPGRLARFGEVLDDRTRAITVVLEDLDKPHNASACLRSCDCFGVQDVHVVEGRSEFEASGEVAMGASRWLTLRDWPNGEAGTGVCLADLKDRGFRILATTPEPTAVDLHEFDADVPTAIVFGNEMHGISQTTRAAADGLLRIPMYGFTESFNISVAVALCLQHFARRLRDSSLDWRLPEPERATLLAKWIRVAIGPELPVYERRYRETLDAASDG